MLAIAQAQGDGPFEARLFGRALVLWRNADGWHAWDDRFLQDKPIVESQQPRRLPLRTGVEVPQPADKLAGAYRRYLAAHGVKFGTLE
ncbi:hypothetical protein [Cupriavidus necator]|uniref:hypothetical protein n=1 Tax=Cupriavidus necator TaxID=106590 RepID=UPI0006910EB0|nr:hypothetical protein [Cupriavidus necator]